MKGHWSPTAPASPAPLPRAQAQGEPAASPPAPQARSSHVPRDPAGVSRGCLCCVNDRHPDKSENKLLSVALMALVTAV